MSNWAGVWVGIWEGGWLGAEGNGPSEEAITGGGGYHHEPYDLAERRKSARRKKREEEAEKARILAEQQARERELARFEAESEYLASIERYRDIQSRKLDEYIAQEPPRFLAALDIGAELQAMAEDAAEAHKAWLAEQEATRIRREEEEALIVLLLAL